MKMKDLNKRGVITLGETPSIVIALVVIGIFLAIAALVMTEIADVDVIKNQHANETAFNATQETLQGLDTLASFQTIIAVVVAAAVILGVVFLIRT